MPAADLEVLRQQATEQVDSAEYLAQELADLLSREGRNPGDLIWRETVVRVLSLLKRHWDAADAEFAGAEGRLVDQLRRAGYRSTRSKAHTRQLVIWDVACDGRAAGIARADTRRLESSDSRLCTVWNAWIVDEQRLVALP